MMTKTYRSILAMLALTVSVAGASYGQNSVVYKGDITGAPFYYDGIGNFSSYWGNASGEYWIRKDFGISKYDALGKWVGDIAFPTQIMSQLAGRYPIFAVHDDGAMTFQSVAGQTFYVTQDGQSILSLPNVYKLYVGSDGIVRGRFSDGHKEYRAGTWSIINANVPDYNYSMLDQNGRVFDTSSSGFTFGQSYFVSWSLNGNTKTFPNRFGGFYPYYGSAISKNAVVFSGYSNSVVSGSVLVSANRNKGSMFATGGWGASPGSFYTNPFVSSRSDNTILAFDGIRLQYFTESLRWLSWDRQPIVWPSRIDSYGDTNFIVHNQYYGVLQRFDGKGNLLNEVNIPSCLDFKQDKSGAIYALVDNYTIHEYSKDLVLVRVRTRSNTVPAYRLFRDSVGAVHVSCLFNPTTAPTMRIVPVESFSELTPSGYELYTNGIDIQ